MATDESNRVARHRKYNCDRITTLIDKGGKHLLRAQAIREGVTVAEMIRRSILARTGLRMLPYPEDLEKLAEVRTAEEAKDAIIHLQNKEEKDEIIHHVLQAISPEPDDAKYTFSENTVQACRRTLLLAAGVSLDDVVEILKKPAEPVILDGLDIGNLRRMLANMKKAEDTRSCTSDP